MFTSISGISRRRAVPGSSAYALLLPYQGAHGIGFCQLNAGPFFLNQQFQDITGITMKPENREDVELETHIQDVFPKGLGNDHDSPPKKKLWLNLPSVFQNVLFHRDLRWESGECDMR